MVLLLEHWKGEGVPRIPLPAFRGVVFEALRSDFGNQWLSLVGAVARVAADREFIARPAESSHRPQLESADEAWLRSYVWQLIAAGVMTVGHNSSNSSWPFLSVTEYGRSVILDEPDRGYLPYDSAGYVERLAQLDPDVRPVVRDAVREASECLFRGTHWAATIMLGVASESLIRELIEVVASSMATESRRRKFQDETASANISRAFERLRNVLDSVRSEFPRELEDGLDTMLTGVFGMIRLSRNEAGHPTSTPMVEAATVHARLILFLEYATFAGRLKTWLREYELP